MRKKYSWLYLVAVIFLLVWSVGPILWSVVMSLTTQKEMYNATTILPQEPSIDNYKELLDRDSRPGKAFFKGMSNSLTSSLLSIINHFANSGIIWICFQ